MLTSCELLFEKLAKYLEIHLIENETHWLRLRFNYIYQKSFQINNKLLELQKWCNNMLAKCPNKLFNSEEFFSIQENALISLISRDDLQLDEVKIWNYIIKWGIAQNPDLPSDPEDWSFENFLTLKSTLKNFLPYIRYFQMSNEDIINNIQPYQQILEKNLWKDIMKKFMSSNQPISSKILPPRIILSQSLSNSSRSTTESFSKIINDLHAAEISSWIDKKVDRYSIMNNPYEFKLLIRGTRDGFTANSFWNLCDKQENIVLIMKVKDTDEILGGYNPIGWDKSIISMRNCNNSFIFSLKNGTIKNSILSRVTYRESAIYNSFQRGLGFGGGCDLYMSNKPNQVNGCWCYQHSYEKRIRDTSTYKNEGTSYFSIVEYETFQVCKKL
ncbi:hypothetical protein C2G38_1174713 [Gigaspora rosea]|uniref:TLDc domain-containing protein n=1 Tax=Gigaspora rosea TaxID=44941 RepID=A0A397VFT3_9GLOM|nr:hypothetical protein C2G38_1174713 [Gigaspora rosea]